MSNLIGIEPEPPASLQLRDCIRDVPDRQRGILSAWLDANADALVDEIVCMLTPLVERTGAKLAAIGSSDTLRGRCAEVAPDWALDLIEGEAVIVHARLRSKFFDVLAAFTLDERELPRPRMDDDTIEQMASRLTDAMLREVLP